MAGSAPRLKSLGIKLSFALSQSLWPSLNRRMQALLAADKHEAVGNSP